MTIRLDAARLERELARRGWNATDLAKASGCSPATISGARRGRAVTSSTLSKIAEALRLAPVVPGVDELLGPDGVISNNGPLAEP
jgi:transcriptional regulator with XRE-family HTH domain